MSIDLAALPDDVAALQQMNGELIVARENERAEAQVEIERLRRILVSLQRNRFGRRSEQMDDDQLLLGLEDIDADLARAETALPKMPPLQGMSASFLNSNRNKGSNAVDLKAPRGVDLIKWPAQDCDVFAQNFRLVS